MPVSKKLTASAAVSRFSECLTYSETRKKAAFAKPMSGKCAQEEPRRCRRSASNPVDRLLLHQKLRNDGNLRTHIAAVDDFIHLTVLQQEFGTLETLWELFTHGLFNHAGTGKADERLGFSNDHVANKAKEAETPPIVGSVSTVMNGRP